MELLIRRASETLHFKGRGALGDLTQSAETKDHKTGALNYTEGHSPVNCVVMLYLVEITVLVHSALVVFFCTK